MADEENRLRPKSAGSTLVTIVDGMRIQQRHLARWQHWRRRPAVSLFDAVALSCGIEPGCFDKCRPKRPIYERLELAKANVQSGGNLEVIAGSIDPDDCMPLLALARVDLKIFGDWVLSNEMELAAECPRTPPPSSPSPVPEEGERQQRTRALVAGMLALALVSRRGGSAAGEHINVNQLAEAAIEAASNHQTDRKLGKSTLSKYIKEGLNILRGE